MSKREDLKRWVFEAVSQTGEASIIDTAKHIWRHHQFDLEKSGDAFYTWQYDMRWAAQVLRDEGLLIVTPTRKWALAKQ